MTKIKINGSEYEAIIEGRISDAEWSNRESKSITLAMDYATALTTFVDGVSWSIVQVEAMTNSDGETTYHEYEYDNSDFNMAGDITDHRDGTITVKMGKPTDLELAYEMLYGGVQ